jgi:hypothetical protein
VITHQFWKTSWHFENPKIEIVETEKFFFAGRKVFLASTYPFKETVEVPLIAGGINARGANEICNQAPHLSRTWYRPVVREIFALNSSRAIAFDSRKKPRLGRTLADTAHGGFLA